MEIDYERWVSKIMGYDFEIKCKPGSINAITDAFSRHPSLNNLHFGALISVTRVRWLTYLMKYIKIPCSTRLKASFLG